jgi:hypothetical protein
VPAFNSCVPSPVLGRQNGTVKVRCIALFDSRGLPTTRSAWVKLGRNYHVLGVWIERGHTMLRLIGEEPIPALFEVEMFEVVSSIIPATWVIASPKAGCISLAPSAWTVRGFWERFFDGEPEAVACFEEERARIVACDP